ncbi:SIMPL domain-containing protein [Cytophagales bacterium LB-30]|uniref:SIMPL domain-containing protein n=1 Tax=Shiella aurantiaca TaxID=3058365 RepID=A0ABT8F6B6_9BACT|nr:SIMPL domain-containing protein [Shiella aurantiaca]MDN4165776.1 SIMPL domain-containing protein [Shiella aurantiaca]
MRTVFLVALVLGIFGTALAQPSVLPPSISVVGEGKVKVNPDYVIISLGVDSEKMSAEEAKKANDAAIKRLLALSKEFKVQEKDSKTEYVNLSSYYKYEEKVTVYRASQTVHITLRDLSSYDAFVTKVVAEGVNRINHIEFKSNKEESLQAEARVLAVKNAQEKAKAMAEALGQQIGKAIYIEENGAAMPVPMYERANKMMMADSGEGGSSLAPGEIIITYSVSVRFVLQ